MKNKIKANTVKQILARVMLVVMIVGVLTLVSCKGDGLEAGFKISIRGSGEVNPFSLAYKSDISQFDINNVTLTFYYGGAYEDDIEYMREHTFNYPYFELYFYNDEQTHILARRVEENLVSEKYGWTCRGSRRVFNHSEELTIPKELFTKETGVISLGLFGADTRMNEEEPKLLSWIDIYYKKDGDKITLSSEEFSEWWEKYIIFKILKEIKMIY